MFKLEPANLQGIIGQRETNTGIDNVEVDFGAADDDIQYGEYKDMFAELETELYPGCIKYSSLSFLAKLMK